IRLWFPPHEVRDLDALLAQELDAAVAPRSRRIARARHVCGDRALGGRDGREPGGQRLERFALAQPPDDLEDLLLGDRHAAHTLARVIHETPAENAEW